MRTLFLKPADSVIVLDPETGKPLDAAGEEKADSAYWQRRILDGDAIVSEPQPTAGGKGK